MQLRLGDTDVPEKDQERLEKELEPIRKKIGAKGINPLQPWTSPNAATLDAKSVAQRLDEKDVFGPRSSLARHYFEFVTGNDQTAPVSKQSYLGLLAAVSAHRGPNDDMLGYWTDTETHRCEGGNQQLATHLAKGLRDVRQETPVVCLQLFEDSVRLRFIHKKTAGSEDFHYVVLATPPAVWPRIESSPPFRPQDYTMAHGPAVKFLSAFDRAFWKDDNLAPSASWDRIGQVWESTDKQDAKKKGVGLSVYSGGDYVLDATTYVDRMKTLYPKYGDRRHKAEVKAQRLVNWPEEPWIETGYSVPAPGQVTTIAKNLSRPYLGRLFFAGEQASPGFFGYMEGALQSGLFATSGIANAVRAACGSRTAVGTTTHGRTGEAEEGFLPAKALNEDVMERLEGVLARREAVLGSGGSGWSDGSWLDQVLLGSGVVSDPRLSAAEIFDAYAAGNEAVPPALALALALEVVATPAAPLSAPLRPGDLLLTRARGSPFANVAVVATPDLHAWGDLAHAGYTTDSRVPGLYAHVLDPAPHRWAHRYTRRVADPRGRLPGHTLILRPRITEPPVETVKGACPDVPVPPSRRPKLLKRESVHSAVREAQRKLNAFHAYRVAAGLPGLADAPLEEDCSFGRHTHNAVESFQMLVFPGKPAEHDGKIGSKTWEQLDAVTIGPGATARVTVERVSFTGAAGALGWDQVIGLDTPTIDIEIVASGLPVATMPANVGVELSSRPPNRARGTQTLATPVSWDVPLTGPDPMNPARVLYRSSRPLTDAGDFLNVRRGIDEVATVVRPGGTSDAVFRGALGRTSGGTAVQPGAIGVSTGSETLEVPDAMTLFRAGGVEVLQLSTPREPTGASPAGPLGSSAAPPMSCTTPATACRIAASWPSTSWAGSAGSRETPATGSGLPTSSPHGALRWTSTC